MVTDFSLPSKTTAKDTAVLAVLVNGKRMKPQHITVDNQNNTVSIEDIVELVEGDRVVVQVLTTQSNSSASVRQFSQGVRRGRHSSHRGNADPGVPQGAIRPQLEPLDAVSRGST